MSDVEVEQDVRAALKQVRRPVTRTVRARLRKRLKEGAVRRAARDRAFAADVVPL